MKRSMLIGCNAFKLDPSDHSVRQQTYRRRLSGLVSFATLPFYWRAYEPERGRPAAARLRRMAQWCRHHGIACKGHPLCWQQTNPRWLADLPLSEVMDAQLERIHRDVSEFRGLIDIWDVVNEAVVMPTFTQEPNPITDLAADIGVVPLLKAAFEAARQANPNAVLILNDFDHSERFERLIDDALDEGVDFDVIGLQSHMHTGYMGDERVRAVCERFARFSKPLHWTEATLISGDIYPDMSFFEPRDHWPSTEAGEQRQADDVERFYRVLRSHPAVEAVTWWDLVDGGWLNAPAGLLRRDLSPKPAYERLLHMAGETRS